MRQLEGRVTRAMRVAVVMIVALAVAAPAVAQPARLLASDDASLSGTERVFATRSCGEYRLLTLGAIADGCGSRDVVRTALEDTRGGEARSGRPEPWPWAVERRTLVTGVAIGGVVGLTAANSLLGYDTQPFHFNREGFFDADTRDGGADKASHFTDYYVVTKEFGYFYEKIGYSEREARWLALGTTMLGGFVNELSDGFTHHGFSPEDLLMDWGGGAMATLISATHTNDLFGFRASHVPGATYIHDVYVADLKLAGVADRLRLNVGPLRFLFVSLTYGVKGYRSGSTSAEQQRQVGLEIGLNLEEILNAVGVTRDRWWGYALHLVADNIRFPYTAIGVRYDLNHSRWHGPNGGNFD
jgi:predicted lipoprotein DUF2279